MLIIPIQDRINWRRPPLLALALVLANILMYVFSLSHDRPHEQALDELDTAALAHYEWPLVLEHLQESDVMAWHEAREANEALAEQILWQHWFDRDWDEHVHQVWTTLDEVDTSWRTARENLEQHRNALSWVRWGFTPAEPTLAAAIISMFLHGDHWHLFGNMVFLLLFAPALERHWGALKLFMIYLVTGFSASLLHWAVDTGSTIPGIGASGAVSGLMGAYVATYGLRKIEFFYTVGFFFGSFRAPALIVFPAWLGKELFDHFFTASNVNYMAHAGGMLGGLLLVTVMKRRHPVEVDSSPAVAPPASEGPVPARLYRLYEALSFDQAWRDALALTAQTPKEETLWLFCLDAAQKCGPKALDKTMTEAFRTLGTGQNLDGLLAKLLGIYQKQGGDVSRLAPPCRLLEAELLVRQQRYAEARARQQALAEVWTHPRLDRLASTLDQGGY